MGLDLDLPLLPSVPASVAHICPAGVYTPSSALQNLGSYGKQGHVSTCERPLWWIVTWVCVGGGGGITGQSILQLLEIKARLTLNPELVLVCLCLAFFLFQSSITNLNGFYCTIIVCTPPHFFLNLLFTQFSLIIVLYSSKDFHIHMIYCIIPGIS